MYCKLEETMNDRECTKWQKERHIKLNTLQELYVMGVLENYGPEAKEAWIRGKATYTNPDTGEVFNLQQLEQAVAMYQER
jgi:hypothetical protein